MWLLYTRDMNESSVTRELDLDISTDELWSLIGDGERWPEWLTDGGGVEVQPGADGVVLDGERLRNVHVRTVEHNERVTFDWWTDDERSTVELEIVHVGGRTGLRVTETFVQAGSVSMSVSMSASMSASMSMTSGSSRPAAMGAGFGWDVRLSVLCLTTPPTAALSRT